ncbi:hypothetical protein ACFX19_019119 [Malus domestica]
MSKYKEISWRGTTTTATMTAAQRHLNGGNKGGDGVEDLAQNDVVLPRGHTSSSKGSHQQLQGTSKIISMASKRSCDPIDPTVAPPQLVGNY